MRFKIMLLIAVMVVMVGCSGTKAGSADESLVLTPVSDPISATIITGSSISDTAPESASGDDEADTTANDDAIDTTQTETLLVNTSSNTTTNTTNTNSNTQSSQTNIVIQQPAQNNVVAEANTACTVRTDLPIYTIVAGDTLFSIATRANMTVDDIVRINCLTDRNIIEVGQQLRLTKSISTANTGSNTNTTTVNRIGSVVVSPWQTNTANVYTVRTDVELTVQWMGMPKDRGLIQVEFIYVDSRSINSPQSIGIDTDLSNGAMISWTPPKDVQGTVYATARVPGQYHEGVLSQTSSVMAYNIPAPQEVGTISISPFQSNTGNTYTVNTTQELTLRWMGVPTELGLTQVEFIFVPDRVINSPVSLGIDTDLTNGAMIQVNYNNPNMELRGTIHAGARYGGQQHLTVQSASIRVEPDNRLMRVGPRGALSADPNIQAGTPADWSDYIVDAGANVTIRWTGVDPNEYNTLSKATLYFFPDNGGRGQTIGHDDNRADGFNFSWTVPINTSGRLSVEGLVGDSARLIFSPEIHIRTSDTTANACKFNPFGIGGEVPVYQLADTNSTQIGEIMTGTQFPVVAIGGYWETEFGGSGILYRISLSGGGALGWVQDGRGELLGDCSDIPTVAGN